MSADKFEFDILNTHLTHFEINKNELTLEHYNILIKF